MSRPHPLAPVLALGFAACTGDRWLGPSVAEECLGTPPCPGSEAVEMSFDEDGVPTFHRPGVDGEFMTSFSVTEPHAHGDGENTACNLMYRGWTGTGIWSIDLDPDNIPLDITFGVLPEGATEGIAPKRLNEGQLYEIRWGGCNCDTLWWRGGETSAMRADECGA